MAITQNEPTVGHLGSWKKVCRILGVRAGARIAPKLARCRSGEKRKGGNCLTHRNHQLLTTIRCLSTVIFNVNLHAHMVTRSVTLTSPGQPGLSFARACMTSQCITSWGLSSNGITSLCPTSWHTLSMRRDLPKGQVCPLVLLI